MRQENEIQLNSQKQHFEMVINDQIRYILFDYINIIKVYTIFRASLKKKELYKLSIEEIQLNNKTKLQEMNENFKNLQKNWQKNVRKLENLVEKVQKN